MKRLFPFCVSIFLLITGCSNSMALIESASTEIIFELGASSCKDEQWVVPGGEEISLTLLNPLEMPQIFIIMARQSTPPFDIQDQDRIYFSVGVPPGRTETSFTAPAMPAEYQVICGPADNLEPFGQNRLVVVQSKGN
jgi:hypothetical protein